MITTVCKISYGSQTVPPIVPAVQGDTGRAISFEIADFTPPAGATATYFILKPSGEAIYNSATITDNSILCELTAQSLAEAGENRMQVRVLQGEDIVTSFEVILMVRTFLGDDAIESGTEMNIFDQAVEQATEQFQENAEQIVEEVIESIPEDYTELTEEVEQLNERLDTVDTKLDEVAVYPNLANPNAFTSGKYVAPDGNIWSASGLSYSEKIPVSAGQVIKANHRARFIAAYNGNTANSEAGVNDATGKDAPTTYTVPEGITNLIFTFRDTYLSDLIIYVYDGVDYGYVPYGEASAIRTSLLPVPLGVLAERKDRSVFASASGIAFLANTFISLPVFCSTRKNSRLVFRAQTSSLGNFEIGFTTAASANGTKYNRFVIMSTSVRAYTHYDYTQSAMYYEAISHGMTITTGLLEIIIEELPDAKVKLTLGNNGNTFVHTFNDYVKNNTLQPYCYSAFGSFANYKFTWSCTDLYKNIWFFGDSYMAYSEARWAYYLEEYGYAKNALINSFPGCWSSTAVTALNNLIKHGNPDFAVWALGMNDGADSDSAPSTAWANGRDSFLAVCEANNITPVFCTIPTVPTINHEQKNAWIRSSGYRYIDFAKAVNAQSNGTWNSGMLSADGVHPTVNGAKALFSEVLLDFPEIMLDS